MRRRGLTGSFWPSWRQERLLRLALDPNVDVERAWRDLQPLEVETLEEGTFALLPLVYRRLEDAAVRDARVPRLAGTYRNTWVRNQLQLERLPTLLEPLIGEGIEPLVVGGAAVATHYYPQLGLRPILQLELLLKPEDATRAGSVVARHGWRIDARRPGRTTRVVEGNGRVAAVLHEGVPSYVCGPVAPAATLALIQEGAAERELAGTAAKTLAPADELLLACGLGARITAAPGIQWLLDIHHIAASGEVDVERLGSRAGAQRLTGPLRDTLAYLRTTTGLDVGATAEGRASSPRERLTHRLAANGLGPLGAPPEAVLEYARTSLDEPLVPVLRGLPQLLRDAWSLDGIEQVPAAAMRKIVRRVGHRQPTARDRSRSTSS